MDEVVMPRICIVAEAELSNEERIRALVAYVAIENEIFERVFSCFKDGVTMMGYSSKLISVDGEYILLLALTAPDLTARLGIVIPPNLIDVLYESGTLIYIIDSYSEDKGIEDCRRIMENTVENINRALSGREIEVEQKVIVGFTKLELAGKSMKYK